jgi:hypothetical protein
LKGTEDPVVARVNERLNLMTNLEMETAEELQVNFKRGMEEINKF